MLDVAHKTKEIDSTPLFSSTHVKELRRAEAWLADRLKLGQSTMFAEVVELTPILAEILLQRNPPGENRKIYEGVVGRYSTDIREGRWELNGESIKISSDGFMNDGQHRCCGVVSAARPIRVVIMFGCGRETRLTLDQGRLRTAGDYLGMEGTPDANNAAAVAGMLYQLKHWGFVSKEQKWRPTKQQVKESFEENPGIGESLKVAALSGNSYVGGKTVLAFCHYVFKHFDEEAATQFIKDLVEGVDGGAKRDPRKVARDMLMKFPNAKLNNKVEIIFRAWGLHRANNRSSRVIKVDGGKLPVVGA